MELYKFSAIQNNVLQHLTKGKHYSMLSSVKMHCYRLFHCR